MPEEQKTEPKFRTMIGGQALIEGIMMMGPKKKSVVVRKQDGELEIKTEDRTLIKDKYPILGWPLIRGVVNFCVSMVTGVKALMYSAEFYPEDDVEETEPSKFEQWLNQKLGNEKLMSVFMTLAMVIGVGVSVVLFILLPTLLSGGVAWLIPAMPSWVRSVIEGVLRIVIFLGYLIASSKLKDMRRVYSYHGAEHKTIFCYEAGLPLTVENVRKQPKHHPRCGTSFLFIVIFVSIMVTVLVFTPLQIDNTWLRMGLHLLLLPAIVAVTW